MDVKKMWPMGRWHDGVMQGHLCLHVSELLKAEDNPPSHLMADKITLVVINGQSHSNEIYEKVNENE